MAFFDSLKDTIKSIVQPQSTQNTQGDYLFCSHCGVKLNSNSKFCSGCGNSVVEPNNQMVNSAPVTNYELEGYRNQRQQEYVGTVYKCPNCGCVITQTTAVCPDCGIKITGQTAVKSVQAFEEQLMEIENSRKKGVGGLFGTFASADPVDVKKLTLIRNFPIPNAIDDVLEFVLLACANIDVVLSKNTWTNRSNKTSNNGKETAATIGRTISDAWVSKMQQAYQKAEIMFPNDSAFKQIQKVYLAKMKELKIKVKSV